MPINKGDRVRAGPAGPEMEVLAVSQSLAICEWLVDGTARHDVFGLNELSPVATGQQAQQPQPTPAPGS